MMGFRTTHNMMYVFNNSFSFNFLMHCVDKQVRHGMVHVFTHTYGCVIKYGCYVGGTWKHASNDERELRL